MAGEDTLFFILELQLSWLSLRFLHSSCCRFSNVLWWFVQLYSNIPRFSGWVFGVGLFHHYMSAVLFSANLWLDMF